MASEASMRPSAVSVAVALALFLPTITQAQEAAPPSLTTTLSRGDRLTITFAGQVAELRGRLVEIRGDQVRLMIDNAKASGPAHAIIDVPIAGIRQIDLERHDSVINGGLVGALYLAACFKWWCQQGMSGQAPSPWIGAGLGALVGGAIDRAIFRQETVFVAPPRRTARSFTWSYTFRF